MDKKPTVLVLGVTGMLGHKMLQVLSAQDLRVTGLMRADKHAAPWGSVPLLHDRVEVFDKVDLSRVDEVRSWLRVLRPDVVVNCVGVIKQHKGARREEFARLNTVLPHLLATEVASYGSRLIHISTDCVFSGRKGLYTEHDEPDATDLYGVSKALGEVTGPGVLTLRTSIIGRELHNHLSLLDWFLRQEGTVRGYTRAMWSGVTTNFLAELVGLLVRDFPDLEGLYHVAGQRISKYDLLTLVKDAYELDTYIEPDDSVVIDRSLWGHRFEAATGIRVPRTGELVRQLAQDPTPYHEWVGGREAAGR